MRFPKTSEGSIGGPRNARGRLLWPYAGWRSCELASQGGAMAPQRPEELALDDKWEQCVDLTLRRTFYSTLAGAACAVLFFSASLSPAHFAPGRVRNLEGSKPAHRMQKMAEQSLHLLLFEAMIFLPPSLFI